MSQGDWIDNLSPEERDSWQEFVDHFRKDALQKLDESAFVMSIVPKEHDVDVKFAVELGASIMLDKPIIAVVLPGARVPNKLRLVADRVVEADIDQEAGRQAVARAIREIAMREAR